MTALGPQVLLLVSSSPDYQRCHQLLAASTWSGCLMGSPFDPGAPTPWPGELSPDVVVCDRPGFEAHGQVLAAGCPPPALLWLLPLGATVPTPAAWPQAPYDYLFTDQLGGDRLHLSLHNLWQQRHLQQQLDHCRQLGEVFHQAGVGINQTDAAGHYIRANQQFCTLVGYSEAELRQLTYHHITHPDDLATQVELERQLFAGEITNTTFEKRFMARDGRIVWARITLSAVYDGQPHPISDLAIVEDITDRVQLKAERQATAARLVKSEARLMEAQRMAHLGHWEYDIIADKSLWSQELLRQYGLDETLSGPSFETFAACIHPEDWPALNQAIQVLINAGTPYALRHRIVRPDGTVRHTFCKGQAVVNDQGQVIKLFGVSQDVTEAWEAEQALQASERRYRQLVENLPNGAVQTLDCQGTVTFIGGKMLTVLGLDPRQVIGRHASEMLEPGAWAQVEPCLRQTLAGHPTQWEMPWWNHHFLFSATPLYGPDGEAVVGILCISQNITPLKQVEAALRHSEQKHRALVQALPDLIMHIDREGVYLDFFAANNMTVIGDTEGLIGQNLQDRGLPYELADLRMAYIRQALETGTLQRYEQTLCNGQMQVIEEVRVVPVGNAEVLVIVRDITGQAQLEVQRRQAEQELRDSERRYATLTETAPVGIFRFDAAENCVYVNPRWCEMTGRTLAMVQGGAWQAMLHPEDRERLLAGWAKALARRAPYRNEGRHLHTDGTVVWFDLQMMPEFDDQGALLGYVGTVSDISDRKQAELALRQAKEELDHFFSVALDLLCIATTDGHFLRLNPAWETTLGYSLAELQAQTFLHWVHEADVDSTRAALAQLGAQKEILNFVNRYRHRDGSYRWIEWRSFPRGHLIYAAARDITHRKTAEMRLERQNALLAQIAQGEPCPTILQALVVEIEIQLPEALASILLLDEQRRFHCGASHRLPQAYMDLVEGVEIGEGVGSCGTAAWRNEPVVVADIEQDPLWQDYRAVALRFNLRACWSFPIVGSNGQVLGVFGTYYTTVRSPQPEEIQVIEQVAHLAGIAIERQQAELALQQLNAALEDRVQQRTQELVRSERDLRTIFNNVYDAVVILDLDGTILDVNDRALEMLGATRGQLLGATMADVSGPEAPLALIPEHLRRARAGETLCFEWQHYRFDDHTRIETEVTLRQVSLWNRTVLLAEVRDIRDRKRAERALRASERRYATLAEVSPVAIFRFDSPLNCTYVSDRWSQMTGRSTASALGTGWMAALHPDDRDHLLAIWRRNYARPTAPGNLLIEGNEGRHLHPDGRVTWFYVQVAPELDADNQVVGYIGTLTDITDRKHIEAALAESEAKFRRLVEGAQDVIWSVDASFHFTYLSPQFYTLFGWSPEAWLGRACDDLVHPDDREPTTVVFRDRICLSHQAGQVEFRHLHQQGHYVWVRSSGAPIYDATGAFVGIQGIISDISNIKRAEQALREANTDLEQRVAARTAELVEARDAAERANQAKSIFLANMSHELRTPLNAILGFSQLMGRDPTLSPQHVENLGIINRSGEHLLTLINDILEMSKAEAGKLTLHAEAFDLLHLLGGLVEMLRLKAESKGLPLTLRVDPAVPQYLYTDSRKLRQVLLNLLSNAIKFTQVGEVTLEVTARFHTPAPSDPVPPGDDPAPPTVWLGVAVADTGMGIAPEEMDVLFEPFVQTASGRLSQEGTGLGLPLTDQFIRLMGGTLAVTSEPGVGSTFAFEIPVQVVEGTPGAMPEMPRAAIALAPDQPEYRILVVEDNWINAVLLEKLLDDIGFQVRVAENGQGAIARWQAWQPHLILMDIRMPGMDGAQATQKIRDREAHLRRQQPQRPPTHIIGLTAGTLARNPSDYQRLGFDDCIRKPFQVAQITHTIAQHLQVQYLYTTTEQPPSSTTPAPMAMTVEVLQTLAPDWLHQFYTALLHLNQEQMLALIEALPESQGAIAQALHHKVYNFDYEPLLTLLQPLYPP